MIQCRFSSVSIKTNGNIRPYKPTPRNTLGVGTSFQDFTVGGFSPMKIQMAILMSLLGLVYLETPVRAQDYCSLVVKVVNAQGAQEWNRVVVEERDGRKEIKEGVEPGGLTFCDLGLYPVTVTLNGPYCSQIVVRNVALRWGETKTLTLLVDGGCADYGGNGCDIIFRFVDPQKKPIQNVSVESVAPAKSTLHADRYGRLLTGAVYGHEFVGTAVASGYGSLEFRQQCNNGPVEQYVTLTPIR